MARVVKTSTLYKILVQKLERKGLLGNLCLAWDCTVEVEVGGRCKLDNWGI